MPSALDFLLRRQQLQSIRRAEAAQSRLAVLEAELAAAQATIGDVETRRRALTEKVARIVAEADQAEAALGLALAAAELDGAPAVTARTFAEATAHVARLRATATGFAPRFESLRIEAGAALNRQAALGPKLDQARGQAAATSADAG
jgi:chromosome segregation ATPase